MSIVYLENFIENSTSLSPELTRLLDLIRSLDERCHSYLAAVRQDVDALLKLPPHYLAKQGSPAAEEVVKLRARVEAKQRLLVQWSEEKMNLAATAGDLISQAKDMLETDYDALCAELTATGQYEEVRPEGTPPEEGPGRRERQRDAEAKDSRKREAAAAAAAQAEAERVRREAAAAKAAAEVASGAAAAPAPAQGAGGIERRVSGTAARAATQASKGQREREAREAREAAERAQQQAAAQAEQPGPGPSAAAGGATSPPGGSSAPGSARQRPRSAMQGTLGQNATAGAGDGGGAPFPPFPIPKGMQTSASSPQALGRPLTLADINERLRGRRAELFWPDDNLWYLIQVREVMLEDSSANIMYVTGEAEKLNLLEIVRDQHMSLIDESSLPP